MVEPEEWESALSISAGLEFRRRNRPLCQFLFHWRLDAAAAKNRILGVNDESEGRSIRFFGTASWKGRDFFNGAGFLSIREVARSFVGVFPNGNLALCGREGVWAWKRRDRNS